MTPERRLALLGFCVGAAYWPGILSAASAPRWWVMALGLPLAASLHPGALRPLPRYLWLAGLAWAMTRIATDGHFAAGALDCLCLILLFGTACAAAEASDIKPALVGLALGLAPSSLLVIGQACGWSPVPQSAAPAGFFFNREILAEFAAPLFVWCIADRRWALAVIPAVPLALCHERLAIAVAALGLAFAFLPRRRWQRALLISALAAAAAALLFLDGAAKFASAGTRAVYWIAAFLSITPWGHGLGWWRAAHPFPYEEFAHSDALQALAELGIGGACLIAAAALCLWRGPRSGAERAAFLAIGAEACVSFPLHIAASGFLFALLAGHLGRSRSFFRHLGPLGGAPDDADARRQAA